MRRFTFALRSRLLLGALFYRDQPQRKGQRRGDVREGEIALKKGHLLLPPPLELATYTVVKVRFALNVVGIDFPEEIESHPKEERNRASFFKGYATPPRKLVR